MGTEASLAIQSNTTVFAVVNAVRMSCGLCQGQVPAPGSSKLGSVINLGQNAGLGVFDHPMRARGDDPLVLRSPPGGAKDGGYVLKALRLSRLGKHSQAKNKRHQSFCALNNG